MATRQRGGAKLAAWLRKAKAAQQRSKGVEVGFFATAKYPDGTYVAAVAAWQNFGVPSQGIPERPFFTQALQGAGRVVDPIIKAGVSAQDMALGEQTAALIGEVMKARIQRSIVDLREPPNAPSTIRMKRSSNPLVNLGVMKQSVDYNVTDPNDTLDG